MLKFILFSLAVIGMTNIIVDPAAIMLPVRNFIHKYCWTWIDYLVNCYQCCGTWCGFFCGYLLISSDPIYVFMCGMAGSFLATLGASVLTYIQAKTLVE